MSGHGDLTAQARALADKASAVASELVDGDYYPRADIVSDLRLYAAKFRALADARDEWKQAANVEANCKRAADAERAEAEAARDEAQKRVAVLTEALRHDLHDITNLRALLAGRETITRALGVIETRINAALATGGANNE